MSDVRRSRILWGGVLALALLIRISAACFWQSRLAEGEAFAFPDSESYWELGAAVANGRPYEFAESRAFRTPGYPLLLSPLFMAIGDQPPVMAARLLGAVLGTVVVWGVGCLAWKLFNERAGLIAALLCALYPGAIVMSILILSEALFCPLMIAQLACWSAAAQSVSIEKRLMFSALAGLAAGLATLTRPSWLLFTPLAIAVAMVFSKRRAMHLRIGAVMLIATAVTMSPWWFRNAIVLRTFVPTTTQVGTSLYDGLHPKATGASEMSFVPPMTEAFRSSPEWQKQQSKTKLEVALHRHFAQQATQFAQEHPADVTRLAVVKFLRMWNIWPNEASLRSWPIRLIVVLGYLPILLAALLGVWKFASRGWPYVLCLLPAVYFTLLHMVFVGSIRYRQPAMLLLIVLAAGWLATVMFQPKRQSG